eukprot:g71332.t1
MYQSDSEDEFLPDFKTPIDVPQSIREGEAIMSPTAGSFLCFVCGDLFKTVQNHSQACVSHFGKFSDMEERWTRFGKFSDMEERWTCCGNEGRLTPGCKRGWHKDSEQDVMCEMCLTTVKHKDKRTHQDEDCPNFPKSPAASMAGTTICARCNHIFARSANRDEACTYHPGKLAYLSNREVARRWDCCGLQEGTQNEFAEGCVQTFHLDRNRKVICNFCKTMVAYPKLESHVQEECPKSTHRALVPCKYCEEKVPQAAMDRHHQSTCNKFPAVNCPNRNDGCPVQMLKGEIPNHLLNCIARKVACPLAKAGCAEEGIALNKIENHISGDMMNHFMLMWNTVEGLTARIQALESENTMLKLAQVGSVSSPAADAPADSTTSVGKKPSRKGRKKDKASQRLKGSFESLGQMPSKDTLRIDVAQTLTGDAKAMRIVRNIRSHVMRS